MSTKPGAIQPFDQKAHQFDLLFSIRIAYQTPVTICLPKTGREVEALPNTFEDSLVLSNVTHFAGKAGRGLMRSFGKALRDSETPQDLGAALFNKLRDGDKAEFALHVLGDPDFADLSIPAYIHEGLTWLQSKLERKSSELLVIPSAIVEVTS